VFDSSLAGFAIAALLDMIMLVVELAVSEVSVLDPRLRKGLEGKLQLISELVV